MMEYQSPSYIFGVPQLNQNTTHYTKQRINKQQKYKQKPAHTKQPLDDHKLIQYDITAGKNYLKNTGFMNFK